MRAPTATATDRYEASRSRRTAQVAMWNDAGLSRCRRTWRTWAFGPTAISVTAFTQDAPSCRPT